MKKLADVEWQPAKASMKRKLVSKYGDVVRISRHDYSIVWCSQLFYKGHDVAGLCSPKEYKIYVVVEDEKSTIDTLIHEIAHGELAASGLRNTAGWTSDIEEIVVSTMAQMVAHSFCLKKRSKS